MLVAPLPRPPFKGGVEKGVDLLMRTPLARRASMRLFNTYHEHDPGRPSVEKLGFQVGMVRAFWKDLGRAAPDLVHVKTSSGINFYQNSLYCLEAQLRRLPVLLQIHSGRFEAFYRSSFLPLRTWIRHTLESVDRVVVLSEYWRERIRRLAPAACLEVVPNGLGGAEIEELRAAARARASQVLFLGTGHRELNRDKGLDDFLAVLPRLAHGHPLARWVIAGLEAPEECRRRLRAEWHAAGSALDKVRLLGTVDAPRRISLLRESTILALPSHFENMPNLLLEGMAAGMGVVATRVGAIPEMLDSGRGGILIEPGNRQSLAQALERLLGDPRLVRRQGRHNAARVASHYTMSVVEDRFENLYREVVAAQRPVPRPVRTPPALEAEPETAVPIRALPGGDSAGAGESPLYLKPMRSVASKDRPFFTDSSHAPWPFPVPPERRRDTAFQAPGPPPPPVSMDYGRHHRPQDCPARRKRLD